VTRPGGYPVLDGTTAVVPLLGDPIVQVKSPDGVTRLLTARGGNTVVVPMQVTGQDLPPLVDALARTPSVTGLIVTVPHKFAAYAHCATATARAHLLGSVNVLRRNGDGSWHGDQLDGLALVRAATAAGCELTQASVLQVGAGGAGSAIALALLEAGVSELGLHDADPGRRDALVHTLGARFRGRVVARPPDPADRDVVVNATPLGMRPGDPLPVPIDRLSGSTFVGDVVTRPAVSPLIEHARRIGCRTQTGLDMFAAVGELLADFLCGADRWE
jgi:shikimate dehydrogenase